MKRFAGVLAMGLGAAIWLASPAITGRREPWDAHGPYFPVSLFAAGVLAGLAEPGRPWKMGSAIYAGQMAAILVGSGGDLGLLLPLGAILLAFYTLLSVAGAVVSGAVIIRARSRR